MLGDEGSGEPLQPLAITLYYTVHAYQGDLKNQKLHNHSNVIFNYPYGGTLTQVNNLRKVE